MNLQQVGQPKSPKSSNGYGRRKSEREGAAGLDNKILSGKSNASRLASTAAVTGTKGGHYESPSRDRLVYVTTCLIGNQVEVQVKNGSIYSGIFHATNSDKDFGIILKMACLITDGSIRGQRSGIEFVGKAPLKTLIVPAKELVQVVAKGVAVTRNDLPSESHHDMCQEIIVDSVISQSRHVETERELQPWVPDEDDPQCPELENIFDGPWNRGWDQFETNETLFGVKSTFNEELYTTKLEKGPRMREIEKQALRIAREIEGEETHDLHLAEERGLQLHDNFDIDEETRFSSVYRGKGVDDSGYDENKDILLDAHNSETFGGMFGSVIRRLAPGEINGGNSNDGARTLSNFSSLDHPESSQSSTGVELSLSGSYDHDKQLASELPAKSYLSSDGENRIQENSASDLHRANGNITAENEIQAEDVQMSKSEDLLSSLNLKKDGSDIGGLSPNATSYAPSSHILSKTHEKTGLPGDLTDSSASDKANGQTKSVSSRGRPGSSPPSGSDCVGGVAASSRPGLSPSSSVGSLSSEKSTLNPNAKEFKLNPNAKSFIPSQTPVRPPSPVSDGSFYFPASVTTVPNMPSMPMGIGIGSNFAGPQQPIVYNPQVAQMPSQAYFHPNGPQYGQLVGHPRQVLYMPAYQPETPYKGRDY